MNHQKFSTVFSCADNLWSRYRNRWPWERTSDFSQLEPDLDDKVQLHEIDHRRITFHFFE